MGQQEWICQICHSSPDEMQATKNYPMSLTPCGHYACRECIHNGHFQSKCPSCQRPIQGFSKNLFVGNDYDLNYPSTSSGSSSETNSNHPVVIDLEQAVNNTTIPIHPCNWKLLKLNIYTILVSIMVVTMLLLPLTITGYAKMMKFNDSVQTVTTGVIGYENVTSIDNESNSEFTVWFVLMSWTVNKTYYDGLLCLGPDTNWHQVSQDYPFGKVGDYLWLPNQEFVFKPRSVDNPPEKCGNYVPHPYNELIFAMHLAEIFPLLLTMVLLFVNWFWCCCHYRGP
jgi:hypothetical protein